MQIYQDLGQATIFFVGGLQSHIIISLEKHSFDFQMKGFQHANIHPPVHHPPWEPVL
jgi:hypothetical protein